MNVKMLSEAGRIHQKCKRVRPLTKHERQKVYASCEMTHDTRKLSGQKKFSPFNTISRTARDSYLLRVTKEPNTQTNYELNYDPVTQRDRRSTIDQAAFKRIIGPINENDYSIVPKSNRDHRCTASFSESNKPKPLTARQIQKYRKTHQHLDFTKQINPERNNVHDYLKQMKTTDDSFMIKSLRDTTQSNFNNYKRFSLVPKSERSHDFKSDSGHEFLKGVYSRQIQPEYNILDSKQQIIRKSMRSPKGELRFNLYRNTIKTKIDRSDPHWLQTLDYTPDININQSPKNASSINKIKKSSTIDFDLTTNRRENQVYSKYPIRQSLKNYVPYHYHYAQ